MGESFARECGPLLREGLAELLQLHEDHLDATAAGEDLLARVHEGGVPGQGLQRVLPNLRARKEVIIYN